ncbi:Na+/H+ antiporter [Streptomyces sp. NPDC088341]|uniref:Na+/H+ antiporter n=1 Tax=Streptomyces sp. NPDC088341 TaxID=3154870 RepID=UPI00343CA27D
MRGLEIIVVVLTAVLALTWLARRLRASEPLFLLFGGVLLGLVPFFGEMRLSGEVVLLIFLPPLLYAEALTVSLYQIKANFRVIVLLAVGLVLVTLVTVAATAHAFGLAWAVAFVLGAILSPTDATAVALVARGMPRRFVAMMQAESLVNDGTALVAYAVAVDIVVGRHAFTWGDAVGRFLLGYAGGIAIGAAVALLVIAVRRRVHDTRFESGLSVLTPFAAYLPAELAHVSGVLAVVVCGLIVSRASPLVIRARSRVQTMDFWNVTAFLLNGSLFVLVGGQLPGVVRNLTSLGLGRTALLGAAVSAVVILTRLAYVYTSPYAVRAVDRRRAQRARRISPRHRLPLAWGGVRGGISLAAALSVPAVTVSGRPVEARDVLVFVTAVVIVATFLIQGQTLPAVIRWARLPPDRDADTEELLAQRHMARAALEALPVHAERLGTPRPVVERLARELQDHAAMAERPSPDHRGEYELRKAVLAGKRAALVELRDARSIDDAVLRNVQESLDAEELRLELGLERHRF